MWEIPNKEPRGYTAAIWPQKHKIEPVLLCPLPQLPHRGGSVALVAVSRSQ